MKKIQTPYGNIDIPHFDESKPDSEDATLANEMYAKLRDWMQGRYRLLYHPVCRPGVYG